MEDVKSSELGFKSPKDIAEAVKANGKKLTMKGAEIHAHALEMREPLLEEQRYAEKLDQLPYPDLVSDYESSYCENNTIYIELCELFDEAEAVTKTHHAKIKQANEDCEAKIRQARAAHDEIIRKENIEYENTLLQLHNRKKKNIDAHEIKASRFSSIGYAFKNYVPRILEAQQAVEKKQATNFKKEPKLPDHEYKELVILAYGRNKGLQVLRDEGYDV